ncbi:MAG: M20/M25/M40 family metallo-hydrolase [Synergistaceae bacterium]|nr:M20/M25/M40 family metallo-hydrolase [Synergistaceae bacterium]
MTSTPQSREKLLRALTRLPSVTGSLEENDAALFIRDYLMEFDYYKKNPSHIFMFPTPSESGGAGPLYAVFALMKAERRTAKTVVLLAHYDVVGVEVYGRLAPYAFDPDELAARLAFEDLPRLAADDLKSGWLFGRGVMDMKCGLALEMELLRDFSEDRRLFDVNLLLLAVGDEENASCGARGAARFLAELKASGLEFLACVNTEPSEPGLPGAEGQLVFVGTLGKLMPFFYCRGVDSHVGGYYRGFSAALLSSRIVWLAEAAPELADPKGDYCQASWTCLGHKILSDGYSVTVPARSAAYFNCFVANKTPSNIMEEMRKIASEAAESSADKLAGSRSALAAMGYQAGMNDKLNVKVVSFEEISKAAAESLEGGREALDRHTAEFLSRRPQEDIRDAGIAVLEEFLRISPIAPPFIAVGFLPPYNPPRTSLDGSRRSGVVVRAAESIISKARERFGVSMEMAEFFGGLCDLSFMGYSGKPGDASKFTANCPGGNLLFDIPFDEMSAIDMPVMNLGPFGRDAHKMTERLEKKYSLEILPELIKFAVSAISGEHDRLGEQSGFLK